MSRSAWIAVVLAVCGSASGQEVLLIRRGEPEARIYVQGQIEYPAPASNAPSGKAARPVDETPEQIRGSAIADLNYHLRRMSGTELGVVTTDDPTLVQGPAIVLGALAVKLGAIPDSAKAGDEAFRLKTTDTQVLIGASTDVGMRHGVYELLRRLGCDWVMPGPLGEVVPEQKTVAAPVMDETQAPSFAVREPWCWGGAQIVEPGEAEAFAVWKRRMKQGGTHPLEMVGGHVWDQLIRQYKAEFEAHPEMLALRRMPDGTLKRQGPQIETTHTGTVAVVMRHVRDTFEKNRWRKDRKVCLSIGPADGMGYSESPESLAAGTDRVEPILGERDVTDLLVLLANTVLERLGTEYPNLYLGFYLYSAHGDYPMRYVPHPRVQVVVADIAYSRYHGTFDANSKTRALYRDILEQWARLSGEQGNPIWFRGYNWNLAEDMAPYSKLRIWGEDIPYYRKIGMTGLKVQCVKAWSTLGPSDHLLARLSWNASLDWKRELAVYCAHAFGKGGPFLEQYYLKQTARQHEAGLEAGSYHSLHRMYDAAFVAEANRMFDEALQAAEREPEKRRVMAFRQPVEALGLYLDYRQKLAAHDFAGAKNILDALYACWQKYEKMDTSLADRQVPGYLDRFMKAMVEQGCRYSTGEYRMVVPLPDRLPTLFDPQSRGHEMGFFRPELNDSNYVRTATFGMPWDEQGMGFLREGAVWYRFRFDVPEAERGQPLGLFVGGVDDEVRVWINGEYIGFGRGFSKPFQFDLTDGLVREGRQCVVLEVIRRSKADEIGTGGILYPCYIFTGPRLIHAAPQSEAMRRVLPGGALGELE